MSKLQVSIAHNSEANVPAIVGPVFVDAIYTRAVDGETSRITDLATADQASVCGTLNEQLWGALELPAVVPSGVM